MAIEKVILNETTQIDLTDKTVDDTTLQYGFTAHRADGSNVIGEAELEEPEKVWCSISRDYNYYMINGTYSNGTLSFSPTTLSWSFSALVRKLAFRWIEAKNLLMKISFDYVITGLVSGGNIHLTPATFEGSSPASTNETRESYMGISVGTGSTGDLSGHYESTPQLIKMTTGTPKDD